MENQIRQFIHNIISSSKYISQNWIEPDVNIFQKDNKRNTNMHDGLLIFSKYFNKHYNIVISEEISDNSDYDSDNGLIEINDDDLEGHVLSNIDFQKFTSGKYIFSA